VRYHRWPEPAGRVRPGAEWLTGALRIALADSNTNIHPDSHSNSYGHSHLYTHPNGYIYSHSYGDIHLHTYRDCHCDSNGHAYAYTNSDPDTWHRKSYCDSRKYGTG
jgi:hypothetical protein